VDDGASDDYSYLDTGDSDEEEGDDFNEEDEEEMDEEDDQDALAAEAEARRRQGENVHGERIHVIVRKRPVREGGSDVVSCGDAALVLKEPKRKVDIQELFTYSFLNLQNIRFCVLLFLGVFIAMFLRIDVLIFDSSSSLFHLSSPFF